MADDPNKRDARDRNKVAGGQDYEVEHFAEKHGLSREEALSLIREHGNKREVLDAIARRRKK